MKRPLAIIALFYVLGLLLGDWLQPRWWMLGVSGLVIAGGAIFWSKGRPWLLWPLVVLASWTNLVCRTAILSPHDLRRTQRDAPQLVTLRGSLAETPSQRIYMRDDQEISRWLSQITVTEIQGWQRDWRPACGSILVVTPGLVPTNYFQGQQVEVTGVLSTPPGPMAEGLFDYRTYLRRQGIYYQLKCESTNDWRLLTPGNEPPLSDRFLAWAQKTLARGLPAKDEPLHLLWAMTLGWKTGLTSEVSEPFMRSGTMHIFAISGLHIALIAGILVSILRVLRLARSWCGGLVVPAIWFYTAATGWQSSAIRSAIMMTIIIGGWALHRPSDLLNSLAAAAFIILVWDPQQLFGASFQLSFFCVLSLGLLLPPIQKRCDGWLTHEPLLPPELVPRWKRRVFVPLRWVATGLATSLASWLGSLPLTAYYFHLFSPVTLLANLLIVPLSSLALACNVGSLLCGSWFGWATELLNHSAWFWMALMIQISDWATVLPGAFLYVRSPTLVDMMIYYVLLCGVLSGWFLLPKQRRWALAAAGYVTLFYLGRWQLDLHSARLTILPFNGALSIFVRAPRLAAELLIDPGNTNSVQLTTKPYLRAQGVNALPHLVLTHGDVRHIGGATLITELFAVKEVCASQARFRSAVYRRAINQFEKKPGLLRTVEENERVGGWAVLHPASSERFAQADDNALVLKGSLNGTRVVLLSDLGTRGQKALLDCGADLRAEIVVTGLPTGGEALSEALLEAIQPQVIIVADSDYPAWERAPPKLRERLSSKKIPVIYTQTAGATTIEFDRLGWNIRTMQETATSGRRGP
jgi:ComEC/Rec2-related protein